MSVSDLNRRLERLKVQLTADQEQKATMASLAESADMLRTLAETIPSLIPTVEIPDLTADVRALSDRVEGIISAIGNITLPSEGGRLDAIDGRLATLMDDVRGQAHVDMRPLEDRLERLETLIGESMPVATESPERVSYSAQIIRDKRGVMEEVVFHPTGDDDGLWE